MKVQAYITFGGRCEEALEFYKKSIGAEVIDLHRWKDSPDKDMKGPPGYEENVMNAIFRIGESDLMADDGMGETTSEFKGMTLAIEVDDDAEAKRVFTALGVGGVGGFGNPYKYGSETALFPCAGASFNLSGRPIGMKGSTAHQ